MFSIEVSAVAWVDVAEVGVALVAVDLALAKTWGALRRDRVGCLVDMRRPLARQDSIEADRER
jgi:hypothetical protein